MIDKDVAVKAIPEEDNVFLVFKVDVGSREHVRVQAAGRQDRESQDDEAAAPLGARLAAAAPLGSRPGRAGGRTWSRWRRTRSSRARAGAGGAPPAAPSSGWAAAGGSPPAARHGTATAVRAARAAGE